MTAPADIFLEIKSSASFERAASFKSWQKETFFKNSATSCMEGVSGNCNASCGGAQIQVCLHPLKWLAEVSLRRIAVERSVRPRRRTSCVVVVRLFYKLARAPA